MELARRKVDLPPALAGVQLKLERAERHLAEIEAVAERVTEGYRTAVVTERVDERRYVCRLEGAPTLPPEFTTVVGDCLHNQRSALDHLAWQLVLRDGGVPDRRRTQFPILLKEPSEGVKVAGGVSEGTVERLVELQPFTWAKRGTSQESAELSPLAVLRRLNNVDKHRGLLVGIAVLAGASWSIAQDHDVRFVRTGSDRSLRDGAEFGEFKLESPDSTVHDVRFDFEVRLEEEPEAGLSARFDLVKWALRGSLSYIENAVLRRFSKIFEE